jgi:FkbM family methyltransferase
MTLLPTIKLALKRALPADLVLWIKMVRHAKRIGAITVDEESDFRPLGALVRSGDSVMDVGANMGYYTKYLSDLVGNAGRVYSVEPIPRTVRFLRHVVRRLRLANVTVLDCAVSDANRTVTMEIPRFDDGQENIFEAKIVESAPGAGTETVSVEAKTLDTLAAQTGARFAFIKCDIEGHELPGLRGASGILRDMRPAWLIEVWGDPDESGSKASATFGLMERSGYGAFWFDGARIRKRLAGERSVNYFFLMEGHVRRLADAGLLAEGGSR